VSAAGVFGVLVSGVSVKTARSTIRMGGSVQLHLTIAELQLLADVLEARSFALRQSIDQGRVPQPELAKLRLHELEEMLTKVIEKRPAFSCDELISLSDLLPVVDREWKALIAKSGDPEVIEKANRSRIIWQALGDKIVESCAMV
jgi:hypothetical protein